MQGWNKLLLRFRKPEDLNASQVEERGQIASSIFGLQEQDRTTFMSVRKLRHMPRDGSIAIVVIVFQQHNLRDIESPHI